MVHGPGQTRCKAQALPRSDCVLPSPPRPQPSAFVLQHLPRHHWGDRGFHRLLAAHPAHLPRSLLDPAQRSEARGSIKEGLESGQGDQEGPAG